MDDAQKERKNRSEDTKSVHFESSTSESSVLSSSSPESTLVKPEPNGISISGISLDVPDSTHKAPTPEAKSDAGQPTKVGRFQVTTTANKVGRFSVSRTEDKVTELKKEGPVTSWCLQLEIVPMSSGSHSHLQPLEFHSLPTRRAQLPIWRAGCLWHHDGHG